MARSPAATEQWLQTADFHRNACTGRRRGMDQFMNALLSSVVWIAEGRSDSPGAVSGVLVILGIVVGLAALAFLGHLLVNRFGRTKRESLDAEGHAPGRVGRAGKRRGP